MTPVSAIVSFLATAFAARLRAHKLARAADPAYATGMA